MRIRTAVLLVLVTLTLPAAALAKGPVAASIEGPGLDGSLTLAGGDVAVQAGFAEAVFGHRDPDPMLRTRPKGELGPMYMVTYTVPGPNNDSVQLRQQLYPYAKPSPLTYTAPGQKFFLGIRTHGGWFVSGPELKPTLVAAGLPATPPAASSDGWFDRTPALGFLGVTGLLGAGLVANFLRRRLRPAPAAWSSPP